MRHGRFQHTIGAAAQQQQRHYLASEDMQALDLVRVYVQGSRTAFRKKAADAPVKVFASLIRIAQPSYRRQFRETVIAAILAGIVSSWISWTMAAKPKTKADEWDRLYKTIRNTAFGASVAVFVGILRFSRSPERDALWELRRLYPEKARAARRMVDQGYQTGFLPSLSARRHTNEPRRA